MARSVADIALLLDAMAGFDAKDSTSAQNGHDGKRIDRGSRTGATAAHRFAERVSGDAHRPRAGARFRRSAARIRSVGAFAASKCRCRTPPAAVPTYYVVASAEASTNLARYDGVRYGHRCEAPVDLTDLYERSRSEGFGREVKRRILTGTYALSVGYFDAYYLKAQRVRRLIRDDFVAAFESVDALLAPTAPSTAFPIGQISDPVEMYQQDVFTVPASLAGIPALALPSGFHARSAGRHAADGTALQRKPSARARRRFPARDRLASAHAAAIGVDLRMQWETRHRPRGSRAARDAIENILRRQHRVRRRTEYAGERRRHRVAGHAAGVERSGRADGGDVRRRDRRAHQHALRLRPQELLLSRPAEGLSDQPVREPDRRRRQGRHSPRRRLHHARSASRARTSKKTPANRCTKISPA